MSERKKEYMSQHFKKGEILYVYPDPPTEGRESMYTVEA
jgi:hypothetical protein